MHWVSVHAHRVRPLTSPPSHLFREGVNQLHPCRMKCLLFALVRKFEFGLVLPVEDIVWRNQAVVRRPYVKGAEKDGSKLPLYVKIHIPDA